MEMLKFIEIYSTSTNITVTLNVHLYIQYNHVITVIPHSGKR